MLEIWRYPVKSLQGERVPAAEVAEHGVAGDRRFALVDPGTGTALTARQAGELLFASARSTGGARPEITLPDGARAADDAALSAWLGRPVVLTAAEGAFHDSARSRLTLVSTGSLGGWDRRRFRANLLLEGAGEDDLVGSRVRVGTAVLSVVKQVDRCVMVTRAQPGGLDRDTGVLRQVHRRRAGRLAVGALVEVPGRVAVGDVVQPLAG